MIDNDLNNLEPYVAARVIMVLDAMRARGFDPIVYEGRRSLDRQRQLYGQGRTYDQMRQAGIPRKEAKAYAKPGAQIVTYTLRSKHLVGKAVDVVSKSRLWQWPEFFAALKSEGKRVGLKTLGFEGCHLEWS